MAPKKKLNWTNLADWKTEGKGWDKTELRYSRLPKSCKKNISEKLYDLGANCTGLHVCFETDSTEIHARWKLTMDFPEGSEHTSCNYNGLDLYVLDDAGKWHWAGTGRQVKTKSMTQQLLGGISKKKRKYMLFFPLRNTPSKIEIGVEDGCTIKQIVRKNPPIVYYGTSIVHGAYASRPGLCHPSILSRWLDYPVINLGFSGSARLEPEMAELFTELDPSLYVIDPLANATLEEVVERTENFVRILRKARPKTPIIMIEDANLTTAWIKPDVMANHKAKRAAYNKIYQKLIRSGEKEIYYIKGDKLVGTDDETSVDGVHPNDIGYFRMATAMLPTFKKALKIK